jgi:hypothetical protein
MRHGREPNAFTKGNQLIIVAINAKSNIIVDFFDRLHALLRY